VNFLNIGPSELIVILLIAILVVGPKRMAEIVRSIGKVSRQMRSLSGEFVGAIRNEIAATEEGVQGLVSEAKGTAEGGKGVEGELTETKKETDESLKDIVEGDFGLASITDDIRSVQREAQGMMQDMLGEVMAAADIKDKSKTQPAAEAETAQAAAPSQSPTPKPVDTPPAETTSGSEQPVQSPPDDKAGSGAATEDASLLSRQEDDVTAIDTSSPVEQEDHQNIAVATLAVPTALPNAPLSPSTDGTVEPVEETKAKESYDEETDLRAASAEPAPEVSEL